jgi:hypothetical protein
MSDFAAMLLATVSYKISLVLSGSFLAYLGYRLYCRGVLDAEGELKARSGDRSFVLRRVAPGAFFALFGTCIVGIVGWQGIHFDNQSVRDREADSWPQQARFDSMGADMAPPRPVTPEPPEPSKPPEHPE